MKQTSVSNYWNCGFLIGLMGTVMERWILNSM